MIGYKSYIWIFYFFLENEFIWIFEKKTSENALQAKIANFIWPIRFIFYQLYGPSMAKEKKINPINKLSTLPIIYLSSQLTVLQIINKRQHKQ